MDIKVADKPALNPVFERLTPSSTLHINEAVNRLWQEGKNVYHLGFGESRFAVHPKIQDALASHAHTKSYLPALGLPALRSAVANYYSQKLALKITSDQIIIGPGSKALIYALQMALDADLYLPAPSWVSYAPQAQLLGKSVHYVPSSVSDNYRFDLDAFERMLSTSNKPQKLLVINSPNNPTGQMFDAEFLKALADCCRRNNVLVISDEIYFLVTHSNSNHDTLARYYPEGTFILGGLSKHLSLGGWRLGVAIMPDNNTGRMLTDVVKVIASETWSSVSTPVQHAAVLAYSGDPEIEAYIQSCARVHGIRTRYLHDRLTALGIHCTQPQGAFYVTANFDKFADKLNARGVFTSPQLAAVLLEEHAIATLPADAFGVPEHTLSLRLASSYIDMETDEDSARLLDLQTDDQTFVSAAHHPNLNACIDELTKFLN